MKQQAQSLNTYFWNVGNDIADIRLLAEGTVWLYLCMKTTLCHCIIWE